HRSSWRTWSPTRGACSAASSSPVASSWSTPSPPTPAARSSSGSCGRRSPMADARLLVVWHSNSGHTREMVDLVLAGARDPEAGDVDVREVDALDATADDVRWASGVILGTPAHVGYMSGALKHFFDNAYRPLLDQTRGLPY